jgi:hypothetical protein
MRKNEILSIPTQPFKIDGSKSVSALLEKMQGISFQGRNLAIAYQVWKKMPWIGLLDFGPAADGRSVLKPLLRARP